ncbi:hypothetical protein V5O48_003542 [Marasmius crinis-equi]|uniref:CUE domain-containing protein n=1 Tax=Marasmius crinis-equi TaxID=585013 RepID=A0ABR3FSJ4_9AGAR
MSTNIPSTAPPADAQEHQEPRNTAIASAEPSSPSLSSPPPMATAIANSPPATATASPPATTFTTTSPQDLHQSAPQESVDVPPADPRLATLKAMFPDFDDVLLLSVLESVGGNQDQAIDSLLGMSDPEYRSDARPQEPVLSQTELDEQFARQLYMQDEQQYHQQRVQWEAQQQRPRPARQSSQASGDRDVMTEVSEQFKTIAETGRKTFGSIVSKVKAKISEYDQQRSVSRVDHDIIVFHLRWPSLVRQPQGQPSSQGNYYGPGTGSQPTNPAQPPTTNQQYQAYQQDAPSQSQAQQPAFYDPNPQPSSPINLELSQPKPQPQSPTIDVKDAKEPQGYDMSSAAETAAPPATGSGSGLDSGKLGLLPKRPVSLLRKSPPPTKPSDSDDELEYVENPFEESHSTGRK